MGIPSAPGISKYFLAAFDRTCEILGSLFQPLRFSRFSGALGPFEGFEFAIGNVDTAENITLDEEILNIR
jgi:hypothetical protein